MAKSHVVINLRKIKCQHIFGTSASERVRMAAHTALVLVIYVVTLVLVHCQFRELPRASTEILEQVFRRNTGVRFHVSHDVDIRYHINVVLKKVAVRITPCDTLVQHIEECLRVTHFWMLREFLVAITLVAEEIYQVSESMVMQNPSGVLRTWTR